MCHLLSQTPVTCLPACLPVLSDHSALRLSPSAVFTMLAEMCIGVLSAPLLCWSYLCCTGQLPRLNSTCQTAQLCSIMLRALLCSHVQTCILRRLIRCHSMGVALFAIGCCWGMCREGGLEALALELLPEPSGVVRRRSEVDRKLDALLGASGKLREASPAVAVKFLRLFNLCDFSSGPQGSSAAVGLLLPCVQHPFFYVLTIETLQVKLTQPLMSPFETIHSQWFGMRSLCMPSDEPSMAWNEDAQKIYHRLSLD